MRERLVVALVGMTVAMIVMYGLPRAYVLADMVTEQETTKVARSATLMAALLTERSLGSRPIDEAFLDDLLVAGTTIEYVAPDGATTRATYAGTASSDDDIVEQRELPDGGSLTLTRSDELVKERISDALLPLIGVGLLLILFAAAVGYVLARRLSRPFGELAEAAGQLAQARFDLRIPTYSIPEAEAIGRALRQASTQLDELLRREREFAANASHQLRTPITALRLTLEDLSMWPETPATVAEELNANIGELDRLSTAINELLALSRGNRVGDAVDVDLNGLVATAVARWTPHLEDAGRTLVHDPVDPVPAHVAPGPVLQVLDVLIENACSHGQGQVTVGAHRRDKFLDIVVTDEGAAVIANEVFQRGTRAEESDGHGLGLTIAAQLATSLGGRLTVGEAATTTFVLVLPAP
ncbi:sensor histidine kinase [Nocardioides gilvus]|uniref:sensor histidine kinase n=1 Tax=Nocardioides gilvus TaxID=1735589 RepID=UPI000D74287D|nr:HAMP domain-containing sensor histidine kinase [Nocardioides gilvus]